jgi:hypothetical protein
LRPAGGALQARLDTYDDSGRLEAASDSGTWKKVQLHTVSGRDTDACLRALRAPLPVPKPPAAGDGEEVEEEGDDVDECGAGSDDDALGVMPVSEAYLDSFLLLPEGEQGHTTEVGQQRVTGGDEACVISYYHSLATVLKAMEAMRRYAAANAVDDDAQDAAALFASLEAGDEEMSAAAGADDGELDAEQAWRKHFPLSPDAALARAVMALPNGCDLSTLQPAKVPATLPRAVARLLGKARRFTPAVTHDNLPGMQARHMRALKRELAEHTRCRWNKQTGKVMDGNPHAGLIACVDIHFPGIAALDDGRAVSDTRGAEAATPGDVSGAGAATAAALKAASATIMMMDTRTEQRAALDAAKDSGMIDKLVGYAISRRAPRGGDAPPLQPTRCAVVVLGDRMPGMRATAQSAVRPDGVVADENAQAVRELRSQEVSDMADHKEQLMKGIVTAICLRKANIVVRCAPSCRGDHA